MSRRNVKAKNTETTHEGAPAARMSDVEALRRSVLACLLWEDSFYESGEEIADRIVALAKRVPASVVAALAIEARETMHLRHVPLLLLSVLAEEAGGTSLVSRTIERVISRADEMGELVAIHAARFKDKPLRKTLSAQMKKGLAKAFLKFDAYQLAKYDRASAVRLRDVAFLCHVKARDDADGIRIARLVNRDRYPEKTKASGFPVQERYFGSGDATAHVPLDTPDTWETNLSAGADKKETFERLIRDRKLGYLALLRNLRNMVDAGCDLDLVREAIIARKGGAEKVFPFRYVAAARAAPRLEPAIDQALMAAVGEMPKLKGTTAILVDLSGSMVTKLSAKSDMLRTDAAAALAAIFPGEDVRVIPFGTHATEIAHRVGMAGIEAILRSGMGGGTDIGGAVTYAGNQHYDRIIVITDEQSMSPVPRPKSERAYMINVASYKNGIAYGADGWTHIDGWSEGVIRYIGEAERAAEDGG